MTTTTPGRDTADRQALIALLRSATKTRLSDIPTIARALGWTAIARLLMLFGGFNSAARVLRYQSVETVEMEPGDYPVLSQKVLRALRVTRRVLELKVLKVTCLPRSIATERTLRAHGVGADVVIGVIKRDGFKAHAWVEVNGYPVSEAGRNEWPALARFRSRA